MAKTETVTPMTIELDGITYTLEFNRNTVVHAERNGLTLQSVTEMETPANTVPLLFFYAFRMHHPDISKNETDKMLVDDLHGLNKDELQRLIALYCAPTNALIRTEMDAERKNVKVSL